MIPESTTLRGDWSYPTRIYFGPGRITELSSVCRSVGISRPLLVTDAGLAEHAMIRDAVVDNEVGGLPTGVFADVRSNPVASNVADGVSAFRAGGHDGVIAFGGGSAMDTGKMIALVANLEVQIGEYEGKWHAIDPSSVASVVAVPTTAGTGSEVGRAAVYTDEQSMVKKIVLHPAMMPKAVVADPELTVGLPRWLTVATGMDALAHCLEAFCSPFCHPMADGIGLEGLRLVHDYLPRAAVNGSDTSARAYMMAAATMGAVAFQKGLGAIHALSHPVGAIYNTHHGLTNAVFMPYVLVFNRPVLEEKLDRLAAYLRLPEDSGSGFDAVLKWILTLREELEVPHTLTDLGVPAPDKASLDELVRQAAADPCAPENPVQLDEDAFRRLYEGAFAGRLDR